MYKQTTFYFLLLLTLTQPCIIFCMKENNHNRLSKSLDTQISSDKIYIRETSLLALEMRIQLLQKQNPRNPQQQADLDNALEAQKLYNEHHEPTIKAIRNTLHQSLDNVSYNWEQS